MVFVLLHETSMVLSIMVFVLLQDFYMKELLVSSSNTIRTLATI